MVTQRELISGSTVKASTTIGFPHGGHTTAIKQAEAERAIADGCQELDMVVNLSKVLSADWNYVAAEIKAIIDCHMFDTFIHDHDIKAFFNFVHAVIVVV